MGTKHHGIGSTRQKLQNHAENTAKRKRLVPHELTQGERRVEPKHDLPKRSSGLALYKVSNNTQRKLARRIIQYDTNRSGSTSTP